MPAEQWVSNVFFPIALIISVYLFFARTVWPYMVKRQDKLDQQKSDRQLTLDKQYESRHDRYIGSIEKVEALLAQIAQHLIDSDDRVIKEVQSAKREIIDHFDRTSRKPQRPKPL